MVLKSHYFPRNIFPLHGQRLYKSEVKYDRSFEIVPLAFTVKHQTLSLQNNSVTWTCIVLLFCQLTPLTDNRGRPHISIYLYIYIYISIYISIYLIFSVYYKRWELCFITVYTCLLFYFDYGNKMSICKKLAYFCSGYFSLNCCLFTDIWASLKISKNKVVFACKKWKFAKFAWKIFLNKRLSPNFQINCEYKIFWLEIRQIFFSRFYFFGDYYHNNRLVLPVNDFCDIVAKAKPSSCRSRRTLHHRHSWKWVTSAAESLQFPFSNSWTGHAAIWVWHC